MSNETASYMKISFITIYYTPCSFYVVFVLCKKTVIAELEIPLHGASLWCIRWLCCQGDVVSTKQPLAIPMDQNLLIKPEAETATCFLERMFSSPNNNQ